MPGRDVTILPLLYDFILWYMKKVTRFPKAFKYGLGERITNCQLDILERIIESQYSSKKKSHFLRQANIGLEKLRYLIRISKDTNCISLKEYEHSSRQLNEIGKMVGGWEKHSNARDET
jgi:four helix bundle protein